MEKKTLIFAHRGASFYYPENTLLSFDKAIEMHADYIEFDVRASRDGKLLIFHDRSLKRLVGLRGYIDEMGWEDLKKLKVGGESIPLLEDVLKRYDGKVGMNIEIKSEGYENEIVEMLRRYDVSYENVIISSFQEGIIKRIKEIEPTIKTALISRRWIDKTSRIERCGADAFYRFIIEKPLSLLKYYVKKDMERVRKAEKEYGVWVVNDKGFIKMLGELGVDVIITDRPDVAHDVLEKLVFEIT